MRYAYSGSYKIPIIQEGMFGVASVLSLTQGFTESGHPHGALQTFYDFHAGNYFDPIMWGSMFRFPHLVLSKKYREGDEYEVKTNTRAVFAAAVTGIAYETVQAQMPRREFDYVDCGMYLAGALTFAALTKAASKYYKTNPAMNP